MIIQKRFIVPNKEQYNNEILWEIKGLTTE